MNLDLVFILTDSCFYPQEGVCLSSWISCLSSQTTVFILMDEHIYSERPLSLSSWTTVFILRDDAVYPHGQMCLSSQTTVLNLTHNRVCSHRWSYFFSWTTVLILRDNRVYRRGQPCLCQLQADRYSFRDMIIEYVSALSTLLERITENSSVFFATF